MKSWCSFLAEGLLDASKVSIWAAMYRTVFKSTDPLDLGKDL